jgi:hypothetical protein
VLLRTHSGTRLARAACQVDINSRLITFAKQLGQKLTNVGRPDPGFEVHAPRKGGQSAAVNSILFSSTASLKTSASLRFSGRSKRQKSPFPRFGCSMHSIRNKLVRFLDFPRKVSTAENAPGSHGNSAVSPEPSQFAKTPAFLIMERVRSNEAGAHTPSRSESGRRSAFAISPDFSPD